MWIQKRRRDNSHNLHSNTVLGEMPEQYVYLNMTFVDFTKAVDTVSPDGLWKIMAKFGCPSRSIAMVRQCHDSMLTRVQNDREFSELFEVMNGAKQGCVMAQTLFRMPKDVFSGQ